MDILKPELVWVEDRCYRFCDKLVMPDEMKLPVYQEESLESNCTSNNDEFNDESIEIVPDRGNRFKHTFHVNSNFYSFIIGAKGATLRRLAAETKTQIHIPSFRKDENVVITGNNPKDIIVARYRIDLLLETVRKKFNFTHFIGIPTNLENIKENFKAFKDDVLKTYTKEVQEIVEELFQSPQKLHLTISMLVLLDEEDRKKAVDALEACCKNIIIPLLKNNGPITIEFKGVKCMNVNSSKAKVLYSQPYDETGCLQQLSDKINEYFIDKGISRRKGNEVKLHMTLMKQKHDKKSDTFDATNILKNHENTYFGKMHLSTICISQVHTIGNDGFYQTTTKFNLLDNELLV